QVSGVVELRGDLEPSAKGFDVGAQDRDGDGIQVAAFDVGDSRSGHTHGFSNLPLGQGAVAADLGEAEGAGLVVEAALRGGAFGIGTDVVAGSAAGLLGVALGVVPVDGAHS